MPEKHIFAQRLRLWAIRFFCRSSSVWDDDRKVFARSNHGEGDIWSWCSRTSPQSYMQARKKTLFRLTVFQVGLSSDWRPKNCGSTGYPVATDPCDLTASNLGSHLIISFSRYRGMSTWNTQFLRINTPYMYIRDSSHHIFVTSMTALHTSPSSRELLLTSSCAFRALSRHNLLEDAIAIDYRFTHHIGAFPHLAGESWKVYSSLRSRGPDCVVENIYGRDIP